MALYIPLFVMSALQIGVSNVATELAYINPSITLICTVVAAFLNLLLSNVAFSLFAVDRSKETVQPARTPPVYLLASTVPLQISGALLIYLVHLILSAIVVFASLASSQLGALCSLVVAVIVTLLSASFVFVLIEDAVCTTLHHAFGHGASFLLERNRASRNAAGGMEPGCKLRYPGSCWMGSFECGAAVGTFSDGACA